MGPRVVCRWRAVCGWRLVAAGLVLVAGCGGETAPGGLTAYTEWDNAGVTVHATPASEAFAPLGWTVDPTPALVLGQESSPAGYFGSVQGIGALADGRVVVLDGILHDLRLFDRAGHLVARAGGTGQGPDEFQAPWLVPSVPPDSVLVFDQVNLRLHAFAPDLGASRTTPVRAWDQGRVPPLRLPPLGAVGALLLRDRAEFNGGTFESALLTEGPVRERRIWFWYDIEAATELDLASVEAVRWVTHRAPDPALQLPALFLPSQIPLSPTPVAAVHGGGAYLASGADHDIRDHDLAGGLRRLLRIDAAVEPTRPGMVQQDPRFDARVASYTEPFVPPSLPTFTRLLVDHEGWLWARLYEPDPAAPERWVLFDESGRARGTVETPAGLEVRAVAADRLYGVARGPLDEAFVHAHDLSRLGPRR